VPHGGLLVLGSGSTSNRRRGAVAALDVSGDVATTPRTLDLTPFFATLDGMFAAPNIEGAAVHGGELRLFQRGNRRHSENAVIALPLDCTYALLRGESPAPAPISVHKVDLGDVRGIPFCFTDACVLSDGSTIVTAVVEDTDNPYDDGLCVAAAIGRLDANARLVWLRTLDHPYKVEGVEARVDAGHLQLLLVTDADDPGIPAAMLSATTAL
jgi:hypothetical protein